jgi:hypothetical protein
MHGMTTVGLVADPAIPSAPVGFVMTRRRDPRGPASMERGGTGDA